MATSESKGRFFLQNESIRIDSHNELNRIDSNRELECSSTHGRKEIKLLLHLSSKYYSLQLDRSWAFINVGQNRVI